MKFESQRVAWWFFATCMVLFGLQLLYGLLMAYAHTGNDVFHNIIPFHVARSTHVNLLVMWLLAGFMGAAYFIIPEEADRELYWPRLAYVQLIGLVAVGLTAIIGFHFQWWEGRKFLEIPRPLDYLVVADVLLFIANIGMTVWKGKRITTTSLVLFFGLLLAALLYLPGMIPSDNQTIDSYWRWWVVHLWVEGVWELILGAILSFLLIKLTGIDREVVEKWLYVVVGFAFLSGILGTGHHYYWIGAPEFWMALGSIFSALEVIPLSLLMVEAYGQYRVVREGGREFPYKVAFSFLVATAFWNLFGAGVLGFLINLPFVSYFQHGNVLTAAHAHGALMGVYGMLALALGMFSLRNIIKPDRWKERWMMTGFWGLNAGLMGMILMTLLPIGTIQSLQTYERGYWWARSFEFYSQPVINKLLWLRMVPDTVFIVAGILPIVAGLAYGYFHLRRTTADEAGAQVWIAADAAPEATPEPSMAAGD